MKSESQQSGQTTPTSQRSRAQSPEVNLPTVVPPANFKWPNLQQVDKFTNEPLKSLAASSVHSDMSDLDHMEMSLCGGLGNEVTKAEMDAHFNKHIITFEQFCENPDILNNPNLVIRMGGRHFNWPVGMTHQ